MPRCAGMGGRREPVLAVSVVVSARKELRLAARTAFPPIGAAGGIRTHDLAHKCVLACQLRYGSI